MVYGGHFKVSYMAPQSVKKLKVKPKATWPERRDRSKFVGFSLPFPLEMAWLEVSFIACPVLTKLSGGEDYQNMKRIQGIKYD